MDPQRAQELLNRERKRIESELTRLTGGAGDDELSHMDQHPADAGSDLFEQERDQSLVGALREELAAVKRAERRLAEGTYGRSIESGEPIPDERLEVQPWAERTVAEQAAYEAVRRPV